MSQRGVQARATSLAALLVLSVIPSPCRAQPVFPVESELVKLDVFVGRGGGPLRGLTAADFAVRDNGKPVANLELVSGEDAALGVVLALDRSQSMIGAPLRQIQAAAASFVHGLDERDRVTVLAFDYGLDVVTPPEASRQAALDAIDAIEAHGPTALQDALYVALKLASPAAGRPVVLLFTDGYEALGFLPELAVLTAARESDASLYLVLASGPAGGWLQQACQESGGRVIEARPGPALDQAFLDILNEVKNRYVLRYVPEDNAPGWHPIQVVLKGRARGAAVRARRGYRRVVATH